MVASPASTDERRSPRLPANAQEAASKFRVLLRLHGDGPDKIDEPKPIMAFLADLDHLAQLDATGH